jgi:sialate O-acetylesterase
MLARIILVIVLSALTLAVRAQEKGVWQNRKCAVSLTYDDGLNVHLDTVVPILDSLGFKGTFYITGDFRAFRERVNEWKTVAGKGNELGNHTLFHPCEGKLPGREWVKPEYDLSNYSMRRMLDEIEMANVFLRAIDGKTRRTFAYPCGDMKVGDSSYVESIRGEFVGARGVEGRLQTIVEIDPYRIGAFMINGESGGDLVALVKKAMEKKALLVFLFHGVGGEHSLNVSLRAHSELLHFLKANEKDIWVAPLVDIVEYVEAR